MRLRTSAYTPSPSSKAYDLGDGRSIRLLPVTALAGVTWGRKDIRERLKAAVKSADANSEESGRELNIMLLATTLFMLWDDPAVEWAAKLDADELIDSPDDVFLAGALLLAREILSVATARIYQISELSEAHTFIFTGKRPGQEESPEPEK